MNASQRVYIVDDDEAVRDSLGFQLESAGYDVRTFSSGVDFLNQAPSSAARLRHHLDVRMPDMDGP